MAKKKAKAAKKVEPTGSVIPKDIRARYTKSDVKTACGARSVSNGDDVARALNGLTVDALEKLAARADLAERFAGWKSKLNPGMVRMNLGNVLRGAIAKGDKTAIATVAEATKTEPKPKKGKKK